jgi:hypothetical protein
MNVTWWVDRWMGMGIGKINRNSIEINYPVYQNYPIISMPYYEKDVADNLYFLDIIGNESSLYYPREQALPMIELIQVGV